MMTTLRFGNRQRRPRSVTANVQSAILLSALLAGILAPGAMAQVQSGIAEVNGTKLYYEMSGSGRVIVLLHGGAVDRRAWDDQFAEFAAKYKVIRYDLRGAGKSASPDKPFSNSEDLSTCEATGRAGGGFKTRFPGGRIGADDDFFGAICLIRVTCGQDFSHPQNN